MLVPRNKIKLEKAAEVSSCRCMKTVCCYCFGAKGIVCVVYTLFYAPIIESHLVHIGRTWNNDKKTHDVRKMFER